MEELQESLTHTKRLEGLLPICANCKKIRNDDTESDEESGWMPIESYIARRTDAVFSHGICPDCLKRLYPGL